VAPETKSQYLHHLRAMAAHAAAGRSSGMDREKLERLRARYANAAPGQAYDPRFKKIVEMVFAGSDRRPKPYEGVSTFLGAPLRLDAPQATDFGGLDVALVGVPMDLGVTNRPGARFGPRAVRGIERIGPYHHVHGVAPLAELKAADVGDVPFRSRFSLDDSRADIEAYFTKIAAAGVAPLSVGGDHSITFPILKACWPACSTRSGPSRSASAAGRSTYGNSPTTPV
jgi:guanidinopropionase